MNGRNLDQLLDAWLDLGPDVAPDRVHSAIALEVRTTRQAARWSQWAAERFPPMNAFAKIAIAAAGVVVLAVVGLNLLSPSGRFGGSGPAVSPSPSSSCSPSPLPSAAVGGQNVQGWPGARTNAAGLYSWAMGDDAGMHHARDATGNSLGVSITFSTSANGYKSGPTPVTVGGCDGTYQKLSLGSDGTTEVWIVEMGAKRVTILLQAPRTATPAQLAEAHAIIESVHYEPAPFGVGVALVFSLPEGWDSG
jgi:hypothetical protein